MKQSGIASDWEVLERYEGGVSWIAHPDETIRRASHAISVNNQVWVIGPVDTPGLDDLLAEYGDVTGVVILFDRHTRDSETIARRHDVSVWVPEFIDGVAEELAVPVERFRYDLAETGYTAQMLIDNRFWQEALLYNEDTGILVVPEAVGTADYFRTKGEHLGVHPLLRVTPPEKLTRLQPDRILVGHGHGIYENAAQTLSQALEGSRGRTPYLYFKNAKNMVFG